MEKKKGKVSFILLCVAVAAGAISLVVYMVYAHSLGDTNGKVIIGLVLGILCGILQMFITSGVSTLVMSIAFSVTAFYFITLKETIGSYADYFSNIVAFGHPDLIGYINVLAVLLLVSAAVAVAACFCPEKEALPEQGKN